LVLVREVDAHRADPLTGLALSAGELALGLVPLYGAFVAGIAVAVADDSLVVRDRNALSGVSFGFFIPVYFAVIGLQLDLIHHFDVVFFLGFLAFACVAKAASVYLGARLSRENKFMSASLAIAIGMPTNTSTVEIARTTFIINSPRKSTLATTAITIDTNSPTPRNPNPTPAPTPTASRFALAFATLPDPNRPVLASFARATAV